LEIGVREGASLLSVLVQEESIVKFVTDCLMDGRNYLTPELTERIRELYTLKNRELQVYLFDTWTYKGGADGDKRLKQLLETINFQNYRLFKGDSRNTLPVFLEEHPERFDLVFVDGDHTLEGAWSDLMNLKDRFKILVFHDLYHPDHKGLEKLFIRYARFLHYPYLLLGQKRFGTGVLFNLN
jgi:galactose-1-phosphate uridylyltransferase